MASETPGTGRTRAATSDPEAGFGVPGWGKRGRRVRVGRRRVRRGLLPQRRRAAVGGVLGEGPVLQEEADVSRQVLHFLQPLREERGRRRRRRRLHHGLQEEVRCLLLGVCLISVTFYLA
ncbi:cold shock protein-1 precursor [Iris pallida]|uniref:Cold shock protein-1 n=1 Tax=Iris pallida TaxID=29817 RepID=A0AAX6DI77_IRIPA|nr:cold shock protein-1 precursor [Iris pallida]